MRRERIVNRIVLAGLIAVPLWAHLTGETFTITLATRAAVLALAAIGLNIALGIGGLVSLGHAVFFGIGGYAMGILAFHAQSMTPLIPFLDISGTNSMPVIWLVAITVSAAVAWVIGVLSLRTGGVYFIMITLAFGQMFFFFSISWNAYGGEDGLSIWVRNGFPGLNTLVPLQFYGICFVALALALFLADRLRRSAFGLALNATRQSAARAETVGIDPMRLKLVAFVISGAVTGLAGALFADLNRFVSPTMFSWHLSGELIVLIILGGVGRLYGPVIGAVVFVALEHWLSNITDLAELHPSLAGWEPALEVLSHYWHIFLGLMLLAVVLFARGGIMGLVAGREVRHD